LLQWFLYGKKETNAYGQGEHEISVAYREPLGIAKKDYVVGRSEVIVTANDDPKDQAQGPAR